MAHDFPLKQFRESIKQVGKYVDLLYIGEDGIIRCNSTDASSIGQFIAFPKGLESIKEFAPISFSVTEISKDLSKLKIKALECDKTDTELRLYDGSDISVRIDRCNERLHTSEFVEFIWSRLDTQNFTELSQSEIDKLKDGQLVALPAFFRDENKEPLKILISGREFAFAKALESISIAAVEKETEYQQNLDHSHVVIRIEYDSVVIFMLCGVV